MKTTVIALSCLTGIVVSFAAGSAGGSKAVAPAPGVQSVAVVRVVDLLLKLSEAGKRGEAVKADQSKAQAELAALAKEIETEERAPRLPVVIRRRCTRHAAALSISLRHNAGFA